MTRATLTRYLVPGACLLAATAALLVLRSSLRSDTPAAATTRIHSRSAAAKKRLPAAALPKQYYVIRSGDTLGRIASLFRTSIDALLRLNPGVEPTTLRPGEHVRVK